MESKNGEAAAADDLYAGLALPKNAKRDAASADVSTEQSSGGAAGAGSTTQEPAAKRQKRAADAPLDLAATVAKLKGYMLVDKKFAKASKLFGQLVTEKMDSDTQQIFVDAMQEMVRAKGSFWSGKKEFEALIQQLVAKYEALQTTAADGNGGYRKLLEDWKFMAITHAQLFTDETYQFGKAAKVVKARMEALSSSTSDGSGDDATSSNDDFEIVMPLLRTLFAKHSTAWSKTMVESVLVLATQKRLRFSEPHREEIDAWTKAIQDRRSAPAVARTAGSDARRNILNAQGSEATLKVGRFNHPLFNKEL